MFWVQQVQASSVIAAQGLGLRGWDWEAGPVVLVTIKKEGFADPEWEHGSKYMESEKKWCLGDEMLHRSKIPSGCEDA